MLDENKQSVIRTLYAEGKGKKAIARLLGISPKTVRRVLSGKAQSEGACRKDKKRIDLDLLQSLYSGCEGYVERVHEVLSEKHGLNVGYSTLTRLIRENHIGRRVDSSHRCHHTGDVPGAEMQHDTTIHRVTIAGKRIRLVCSGLYLRYSKMRYIKFYLISRWVCVLRLQIHHI